MSTLEGVTTTLSLLEQYDKSRIKLVKKSKAEFVLEYEEASDLFGQDNEGRLAGIIKNI